jgi:transposase
VAGLAGRDSGRVDLAVVSRASRAERERVVEDHTTPGCPVDTDEWRAYARRPESDRGHAAVCHTPGQRQWPRDDDGDGVNEVHNNTRAGTWTGRRNFLRPFRGVSQWFLDQYVAVFQWAANCPFVGWDFIQALLFTNFAP